MKKCKICGEKFVPSYSSLQPVCPKIDCLIELWKREKDKQSKGELKRMKERIKTRSEYLRELQQVFNQYVRLRDRGKPCISCGKPLQGKYDAGHMWTTSAYPNLRFHEDNVNGQCVECNQHKHGNVLEYREGLINRIGKKRVDELFELRKERLSLSIPEIKELIVIYKKKVLAIK